MDTRSKILSCAEAIRLRGEPVILVTGYFDVLRPEHVRDLEDTRRGTVGSKLLVTVLPRTNEWISQRARTEMVSALRVIDYVVIGGDGVVEALIECLRPILVARLEAAEERRDREFRERVRSQQKS